jgi:hypothetical protein
MQNRTGRTGHEGLNKQNRTSNTEQGKQNRLTRQPGQETVKKGLPAHVCQDKTARVDKKRPERRPP